MMNGRKRKERKTAGRQDTCSFQTMESPAGRLKLVASERGLAAILWENDDPHRVRLGVLKEDPGHAVLLEVKRQLTDYFNGRIRQFKLDRFACDFRGTEFQKKVWDALLEIPFGETRSYGEIALQIGRPKAARAVGAANAKNPISIIAPCHRVVGCNGALTGFAGGLETKALLLELESKGQTPNLRTEQKGIQAARLTHRNHLAFENKRCRLA